MEIRTDTQIFLTLHAVRSEQLFGIEPNENAKHNLIYCKLPSSLAMVPYGIEIRTDKPRLDALIVGKHCFHFHPVGCALYLLSQQMKKKSVFVWYAVALIHWMAIMLFLNTERQYNYFHNHHHYHNWQYAIYLIIHIYLTICHILDYIRDILDETPYSSHSDETRSMGRRNPFIHRD